MDALVYVFRSRNVMLTPFQIAFLEKRGIVDIDIESFVEANIASLREPTLMEGLEQAGNIIESAIAEQQRICIVGDFDADGITSTAMMLMALRELGGEHVSWYINSRFELGYGFQIGTIDEILLQGPVDLIITVDNGISSLEAVKKAKELGIQVVITDHHEPGPILPEAAGMINPKLATCSYPDQNLAGVGVAFKLIQYLFHKKELDRRALLYLDLVAIGTVADVMTLIGENRVIVKNGLKLINWKNARAGIKAIKKIFSIHGDVSTYHLGFIYGPALNAQGRICGIPDMAIELLTTRDVIRAEAIATELFEINRERQQITRNQVEGALVTIGETTKKFIVYYNPDLHEGIVGLIAGRVKEKYSVPTLILTSEKEAGLVKGSARSVVGFDVKKHLIDDCQDLLVKGGGHAMAAGVTLKVEDIPALQERLESIAATYDDEIFQPDKGIDFVVDAKEITLDLVDEIQELAPFGSGFMAPVFQIKEFQVQRKIFMGTTKQHLKLVSEDGIEVVAFGQAESYLSSGEPMTINPVGRPGKNEWMGKVTVQFTVKGENLNIE